MLTPEEIESLKDGDRVILASASVIAGRSLSTSNMPEKAGLEVEIRNVREQEDGYKVFNLAEEYCNYSDGFYNWWYDDPMIESIAPPSIPATESELADFLFA